MNFIQLFQMLDTNQSTNAKRSALVEFIRKAHPLESALAVEALTGRRERRHLKTSLLKQAAYQIFADESWLFEECYAAVGDFQRPWRSCSQIKEPFHKRKTLSFLNGGSGTLRFPSKNLRH